MDKENNNEIQMPIRHHRLLEDGEHVGELIGLQQGHNGHKPYLRLRVLIVDHGVELSGFANVSESSISKLVRWLTCFNPDLAFKDTWSSSDVLGRRALVKVKKYLDNTSQQRQKIVDIQPLSDD